MGKSADNERLKLIATYYNNVSVGLTLAGFILPLFTVFAKIDEFGAMLRMRDGPFKAVAWLLSIVMSFVLAAICHEQAKKVVKQLED